MVHQAAVMEIVEIQEMELSSSEDNTMPAEIAATLSELHVFQEPEGLPPPRLFDHSIPLVPGARPVNLRPYRYSPAQKDEIERQISKMLQQGIIRPSCSPFASPVLLVLKKDLTWRLCIDYRHLNFITVKNRYTLPIIKELIDELSGPKWFTRLDLRAGYHQIRMNLEDEAKNRIQDSQWSLRVQGHVLWADGGTCNIPEYYEHYLSTTVAQGSAGVH